MDGEVFDVRRVKVEDIDPGTISSVDKGQHVAFATCGMLVGVAEVVWIEDCM